jgi:hypothetical protein
MRSGDFDTAKLHERPTPTVSNAFRFESDDRAEAKKKALVPSYRKPSEPSSLPDDSQAGAGAFDGIHMGSTRMSTSLGPNSVAPGKVPSQAILTWSTPRSQSTASTSATSPALVSASRRDEEFRSKPHTRQSVLFHSLSRDFPGINPKDRDRERGGRQAVPASPKAPTQPIEPKLATPIVVTRVEESRRQRRQRAEAEDARQETAWRERKNALFRSAMRDVEPSGRHPHERILRKIVQDPSLTRKQQNRLRAALPGAYEGFIYSNGFAYADAEHGGYYQ